MGIIHRFSIHNNNLIVLIFLTQNTEDATLDKFSSVKIGDNDGKKRIFTWYFHGWKFLVKENF